MPSIIIKTADELARQRHAGELLASVFTMLDGFIAPGVTTMAINNRVEDFIVNTLRSRPASKGQYDFPYVLNTSVNEVVCHGIPKESEHLKSGSIVNVDITLEKDGLIADSSKMYLIGDVSPLARRLVKKTYEAMWKGIEAVKPGATLGDIGHAIQSHVESNGYSVVREYCGHGVGKEMHEEPQVLHYGRPGEGAVLKEGMVFTIEPMVNQGDSRIKTKKDGWTVVTRDKKLSAQWEHTIAVTADGYEVLTLRPDETLPN
ncbi:type I methionyl aminopeptidase [Enterobacter huaxiensis]|jgi:methionyl aminopeptidase|uniref:Methionine aminopeptidase n=1 Tax=Enterobacter huaxiensis TaxID=2494702 RepID=A0ABU6EQN4_9ENTR|nr:type I methionyl aminopeptidase [Enterobacter huaxiensis]MCS5450653.1 type I methionyl aminopeptidase [Enterobacter huaxiensis]MEB7543376.1 type I methionyl aminopeptidase [Enterobacter huaxiensis]MEB7579594.1 type I methionyl aminopeptidase [Enterobacter huaxiensis]MEB7662208.1 type I methionyl aminopeptidase [Enterobacter huaxiensis]UNC49463.1 type I methionyl aminopeptidase [Enterobacter huaxiensis]